jgi:hypothetical protein
VLPTPPIGPRRPRAALAGWLFLAAALALLAGIGALRAPMSDLRGDEGTYVAMTASLATDADLRFTAEDALRATARGGGAALILQRTDRGVAYSKPVLYPLLAAPFHRVAGERGMILFHLLALAGAFALVRALLARAGDGSAATATVLVAVAGSIVLPYAFWRMSESLVVALAAAGLALAFAGLRAAPAVAAPGWAARLLAGRFAPEAGGLLLGALVSLREPHAAVAAAPVLAALALRRWARAARLAAAVAAAYVAVLALSWALTGAAQSYKAVRTTFDATTGWPAGPGSEVALARFDDPDRRATSTLALAPVWKPRLTAYAALYFWIGRHAGVVVSFPVALALLAALLGRPDRVALAALAGAAGLALFYLVWWPANFFGGETFVGNRYLLAAYPCLLVGLRRLPSARALAAGAALATAVGLSALASVAGAGALDPTSQSHAHAGLYRLLPYESTASNIDGRRDRYWSGDFLRFVDPFAEVAPWSFALDSRRPSAEIELGTVWAGDRTTWLAVTDAPRATLVVSDWRRSRRYPLAEHPGGGAGGPIVVDAAPAWRVHPFWWSEGAAARARLLRFALETPDGAPARAQVRYLGREPLPADFARLVHAVALPRDGVAGGSGRVTLHLRNMSAWDWTSDAALAVQLGWRLRPLDGGATASEGRTPLPGKVRSGDAFEVELAVPWPARPGRYLLEVDLVLEDVAWFADRVGAPVAAGEVEIRAADRAADVDRIGSAPR